MAKLSTRDLKHLRALAATDARLLSGAASVDIKLLAALLEEYDRADALAAQVAQREYAIKAWKEEEALWKEREAAQVARVRELEAEIITTDAWNLETLRTMVHAMRTGDTSDLDEILRQYDARIEERRRVMEGAGGE